MQLREVAGYYAKTTSINVLLIQTAQCRHTKPATLNLRPIETCRLSQRPLHLHLRGHDHLVRVMIPDPVHAPPEFLPDRLVVAPARPIHPVVHVARHATALHQPLRPLVALRVEHGERGVVVRDARDLREQRRHDGGVLDAEPGAGAVVRRGRVRRVAQEADAALVEGRERVAAGVEDAPAVEVRFEHLDDVEGRLPPAFEVFEGVFLLRGKRQLRRRGPFVVAVSGCLRQLLSGGLMHRGLT